MIIVVVVVVFVFVVLVLVLVLVVVLVMEGPMCAVEDMQQRPKVPVYQRCCFSLK
jgi:hypothetical protein